MRFSQVAKGTRAEKVVTFKVDGVEIETILRPLTAGEEVEIISRASEAASKKGVRDPKPGDTIYEVHLQAETVAMACLDPDSPKEARGTTFESPAEVLGLDSDSVLMLFEKQRLWQEECSPSIRSKTTQELYKIAKEVGEANDPFASVRFSPRTRWELLHFSVALLLKSPVFKELFTQASSGTSSDVSGPTTSAKKTEDPPS